MASPKAYSTINTVLKYGTTADAVKQLTKIKTYPQLGGSREQIETTDLEDTMQTFVPGVQSVDSMEFTANYTPEGYDAIKKDANKEGFYELDFGADGANGAYTWTGQHDVYINEGEVNGVREMTITVTPSSVITKKTATV